MCRHATGRIAGLALLFFLTPAWAWVPLPVVNDPLVRLPGMQPAHTVNLEPPAGCLDCHNGYDPVAEPGFNWRGSLMAQAARDPIFWATMVVSMQDSIWALGNPNAVDICLRCHFPEGWLSGRSEPPNASAMTGSDFDGVHCDACHRLWNPFFNATHSGAREGADWAGYWDEAGNTGPGSGTLSQTDADATLAEDLLLTAGIARFNGGGFFAGAVPMYGTYTENGAGQMFLSPDFRKRGPFADWADPAPAHEVLYSRYHKSRYFCSTCHDVSNPILANGCEAINAAFGTSIPCLPDQSGGQDLITEQYSAHRYGHVERTFSEFILSAYGTGAGAATNPEFQAQGAPAITWAASCQHCHMQDVTGKGCHEISAPIRPDQSVEHPNSGVPKHDLTGGNAWISYILASLSDDGPVYDSVNLALLDQGPSVLTLNLDDVVTPLDSSAELLAGSQRALLQLRLAATIKNVTYDAASGGLAFRIQNNTGHKLPTGYTEGRRMFLNIKVYIGGELAYEINPYSYSSGTLKGLPYAASPPLGPTEAYADHLVYETHLQDLLGETKSFHFALGIGRTRDNRIPPKGFDIANAAQRLVEPVWAGASSPGFFTPAEYTGGHQDIDSGVLGLAIPGGAGVVEITAYYQGTTREYVEFLRDEIEGTGNTLPSPTPSGEPQAYIIQVDPFFSQLRAWGDTIWQLWYHNHGLDGSGAAVPGIVPYAMNQSKWVLYGDFNTDGTADSLDTLLLAHYLSGSLPGLPARPEQMDMQLDGTVGSGDLTALLGYLAGVIPSLPVS